MNVIYIYTYFNLYPSHNLLLIYICRTNTNQLIVQVCIQQNSKKGYHLKYHRYWIINDRQQTLKILNNFEFWRCNVKKY